MRKLIHSLATVQLVWMTSDKGNSMKTSLALKSLVWTLMTQAVYGAVTVTPSITIQRGKPAVLVCQTTATGPFNWNDGTTGSSIYTNGNVNPTIPKYSNFGVVDSGSTSTLNISNIELEDEGLYVCVDVSDFEEATGAVTVEVGSTRTLDLSAPCIAGSTCTAQCDAVGGKPQETITWSMSGDTNDTNPANPDPDLTNSRSVLTFTPTSADDGQQLTCSIGGHTVSALNGVVSETLNVQYPPASDAIELTFDRNSLDVTCRVLTQPNPSITNFWIYQNSELIHESTSSVGTIQLSVLPQNLTVFKCDAGNYLGNATASYEFDPMETPSTTPVFGDNDTRNGTDKGSNIPAIVGGVFGSLAGLCVIGGGAYYATNKKNKKSGSSRNDPNGSNKVSTEKMAPTAPPRNIEHTTDNPGGDEYAMVSKPPGRGSSGDRVDGGQNGKGQPDTGMHYADLDLSTKAGHTEQRVPKNENDVVVYSSILV